MPNYKKELESYRCGDLFLFEKNATVFMLTQTGLGRGMLVGLCDGSNRICGPDNKGGVLFEYGLSKVSKEEFKEIVGSAEIHFGKIFCLGNISEFVLKNIENDEEFFLTIEDN